MRQTFKLLALINHYYDLDAPDDVFDRSNPDQYLNWKAQQMDIEPLLTYTDYKIYEAFKPYMGANISKHI